MKNSFHTFSCNTYPYAVLSSFKDRDKVIIALLRSGFTAAWSSGIGRDEPRRSAQNVMENTTCKGTSGCFSVDCASQSVKHDAGCGGAEKRESAEEEKEESRVWDNLVCSGKPRAANLGLDKLWSRSAGSPSPECESAYLHFPDCFEQLALVLTACPQLVPSTTSHLSHFLACKAFGLKFLIHD